MENSIVNLKAGQRKGTLDIAETMVYMGPITSFIKGQRIQWLDHVLKK